MSNPAAIIVPAVKKHTATVIMLHGLGDSGKGWVSLAYNFRRRQVFDDISFVFPNAPTIPITGNMGLPMPGWYDISSFTDLHQKSADEARIRASQAYIHSLISAETRDHAIPPARVLVGGFSQGGAMALLAGVTAPAKIAGFFGLSSYLLMPDKLREWVPEGNPNKDTPVFMGHGDKDPLVRHDWGKLTAEKLREWGWNVDFRTYAGLQHSAATEEIDDVEQFIRKCLPELKEGGEGAGAGAGA